MDILKIEIILIFIRVAVCITSLIDGFHVGITCTRPSPHAHVSHNDVCESHRTEARGAHTLAHLLAILQHDHYQ